MNLFEIDEYIGQQYANILEEKGVDTVCFMGYGYSFDDIKIGSTFYKYTLLYVGRNMHIGRIEDDANKEKISFKRAIDKTLDSILDYGRFKTGFTQYYWGGTDGKKLNIYTDKFKLIQKYKFVERSYMNVTNGTITKFKSREHHVVIQNLRTKEKIILGDRFNLDHFELFLFDEID